jgi:hypothetical protein
MISRKVRKEGKKFYDISENIIYSFESVRQDWVAG